MSIPPPRTRLPLPTSRGWWLVVAGLAAGLALFLMLWMNQRASGPPQDGEQVPDAVAPVFQPLPVPPVSGTSAAADITVPAGAARLDEPKPAHAPPNQPSDLVAADMPLRPTSVEPVASRASPPVPIESPGPDYPARALRRGDAGEVLLRIHVDARGVPARVEVASSSGSRDLDRAAIRAARHWRFRPAVRDGSPVDGMVDVPIVFAARR